MERAAFGLFFAFGYAADEVSVECSAGHAYRTLDDADIFFVRIDIDFFKIFRRIAFFGRDENGSHLNGLGSQLQETGNVLACGDSSGCNHRNVLDFLITLGYGYDFGNQVFQRIAFVVDLFFFETEVSSRFGTLDDKCIGEVVVGVPPFLADYFCCP